MKFDKLPDRASYFDEPADLLYDHRLDLRVQYEHIAVQRRRTEAVRQAVRHAEFTIEQNYKTAIPQYYWPTRDDNDPGKLRLLLPLSLEDLGRTDLALSVDREGNVYRAATVLTLDMAYNNARLIARPDRELLEPVRTSGADVVETPTDDAAMDSDQS